MMRFIRGRSASGQAGNGATALEGRDDGGANCRAVAGRFGGGAGGGCTKY